MNGLIAPAVADHHHVVADAVRTAARSTCPIGSLAAGRRPAGTSGPRSELPSTWAPPGRRTRSMSRVVFTPFQRQSVESRCPTPGRSRVRRRRAGRSSRSRAPRRPGRRGCRCATRSRRSSWRGIASSSPEARHAERASRVRRTACPSVAPEAGSLAPVGHDDVAGPHAAALNRWPHRRPPGPSDADTPTAGLRRQTSESRERHRQRSRSNGLGAPKQDTVAPWP